MKDKSQDLIEFEKEKNSDKITYYDNLNVLREYAESISFVAYNFEKSFNEYSWELDKTFTLPNGSILSIEKLLEKFNLVFLSFNRFINSGFEITDISYRWNEEDKGIGHVEGKVHYDAELESGELVKYEGPFKLYMANEFGMWKSYYFVFPGFNWDIL